jgi:hypothetical protein
VTSVDSLFVFSISLRSFASTHQKNALNPNTDNNHLLMYQSNEKKVRVEVQVIKRRCYIRPLRLEDCFRLPV